MKIRTILLSALLLLTAAAPASAACWQWSKTADNNSTADPTINWAEGMSPSSVNDSARAMMARSAECRDDLSGLLATGGSSTAYTLTTNQGVGAPPQDGQQIVARFHVTNGAAPTLTADGGTAYAIQTAVGTAASSGLLNTNGVYRLTFKLSSTSWILQDFYNAPIADGAVTYAKIQNVAASRLLGNPTGSPAVVSEISLGAGLSFSGTTILSSVDPTAIPGFLSGLELSTAGSSSTFSVAKGGATDVNYAGTIYLSASISKTTASWAVGSGNGALDSGSIAINTWYHAFTIKRPDTGVIDSCISTSATGCAAGVANIPAAYTLKRRIGSMKTDASNQWILFTQTNDTFIWSVSVNELSSVVQAATRTTLTLAGAPTGVVVNALFRGGLNVVGAGGAIATIFTSLQESDQAPVVGAGSLNDLETSTTGLQSGNFARFTNTSAQIGYRGNSATGSVSVNTYGWVDARGK